MRTTFLELFLLIQANKSSPVREAHVNRVAEEGSGFGENQNDLSSDSRNDQNEEVYD